MPSSPWVMANISASLIAAAFDTEYGADGMAARSPAADAVLSKYPSPRAIIDGNTARAA